MESGSEINVLMYHSISQSAGPTSIPPEIFGRQIETLADCGYQTISFSAFNAWRDGKSGLPLRPLIITFDDGFADFADCAFPILKAHGYTATVFLPAEAMGSFENWEGADRPARRLMSWQTVKDLANEGIDFGGHSCTHVNLIELSPDELGRQVRRCREILETRLDFTPLSFAPPYGLAGNRERAEIRKWFEVSAGTRLGRATRQCDRFDVPRIEMHYFRNVKRWRDYLSGRGEWYFRTRRALRGARELMAVRHG